MMMNQFKMTCLAAAASVTLVACGNPLATKGQVFDLVVYGVYSAPDGATGNQSPKFYEMTLTQVDLVTSAGDTVTFEPDDPEAALRIIDRPQIILSEDIADYEGLTITSANVLFGSNVVVGGKYQSDYDLTLTSSTISASESFPVDKGKGVRFTVAINWRNTITRDEDAKTEAIGQPTFTVETESQ